MKKGELERVPYKNIYQSIKSIVKAEVLNIIFANYNLLRLKYL